MACPLKYMKDKACFEEGKDNYPQYNAE